MIPLCFKGVLLIVGFDFAKSSRLLRYKQNPQYGAPSTLRKGNLDNSFLFHQGSKVLKYSFFYHRRYIDLKEIVRVQTGRRSGAANHHNTFLGFIPDR
jgi:hypothetical protein